MGGPLAVSQFVSPAAQIIPAINRDVCALSPPVSDGEEM